MLLAARLDSMEDWPTGSIRRVCSRFTSSPPSNAEYDIDPVFHDDIDKTTTTRPGVDTAHRCVGQETATGDRRLQRDPPLSARKFPTSAYKEITASQDAVQRGPVNHGASRLTLCRLSAAHRLGSPGNFAGQL
jgi:hypothetical protein